jgi:hypothetical protein
MKIIDKKLHEIWENSFFMDETYDVTIQKLKALFAAEMEDVRRETIVRTENAFWECYYTYCVSNPTSSSIPESEKVFEEFWEEQCAALEEKLGETKGI